MFVPCGKGKVMARKKKKATVESDTPAPILWDRVPGWIIDQLDRQDCGAVVEFGPTCVTIYETHDNLKRSLTLVSSGLADARAAGKLDRAVPVVAVGMGPENFKQKRAQTSARIQMERDHARSD